MSLRQLLIIVFCVCGSLAQAVELTSATNLRTEAEVANRQGTPLIILYSRQRCPYCEIVRRDYLHPMQNQSPASDNLVIRQINIDSDAPLTDFSGKPTTHARFAAQQKIYLVPVVAFYGQQGETLSAPIIGVRIADFYQSYLDEAIKDSTKRLGEKQSDREIYRKPPSR
jgi:thioredoxin-related protein